MSDVSASPDRPLVIHIGYHKTGTTWLQRRLFTPQFGYRPLMTHTEVHDYITKPHTLCFDDAPLAALVDERRRAPTDCGVDVISSEILSGNPFYGGRESVVFADRLQSTFPQARILITIREQFSMMASVYMQYLRRSGRLSRDQFFCENAAVGYNAFSASHFEFDRLVARYQELFGANQVLVLTQEQMAQDALAFIQRIGRFAGHDGVISEAPYADRSGASYSETAAPLLRRVNYLRSGPAGPETPLPSAGIGMFAYRVVGKVFGTTLIRRFYTEQKPITRYLRNRFKDRFHDSNQRLQSLIGGDIHMIEYEGIEAESPNSPDTECKGSIAQSARAPKLTSTGASTTDRKRSSIKAA